jgi:hypothetical protein
MNPHPYAHFIFTEVTKTYDGRKTASSTNVAVKSVICLQKPETVFMFISLH